MDSYEDYVSAAVDLRKRSDKVQWDIGDLAAAVETRYGEGTITRFAEDVEINVRTLQNWRTTALAYPPEKRRNKLSWSAHSEALTIRDEGHRELVLWQAEVEGKPVAWIRGEAQAWVNEHSVVLSFDPGDDPIGHAVQDRWDEIRPSERPVVRAILDADRENRLVTSRDLQQSGLTAVSASLARLKQRGIVETGQLTYAAGGRGNRMPSLHIAVEREASEQDELLGDDYEPEGTKSEAVWQFLYAIEALAQLEGSAAELYADLHENQLYRLDRDLSKAYELMRGLRAVHQEHVVNA